MQKTLVTFALAASLGLIGASAAHADTLSDVKAKGYLQCGVTGGVAGFSAPDANNVWAGLEVDFCRAVAAAIFNNADSVRYTPLTSQERFAALSAGEIDILSRTTTWTMSRDTDLGISFIGTMYYDGQGFMVRKADGIASALDLSGAAICIESGTTTELNAADYFAANNLEFNTVVFVDQDEVVKAYAFVRTLAGKTGLGCHHQPFGKRREGFSDQRFTDRGPVAVRGVYKVHA